MKLRIFKIQAVWPALAVAMMATGVQAQETPVAAPVPAESQEPAEAPAAVPVPAEEAVAVVPAEPAPAEEAAETPAVPANPAPANGSRFVAEQPEGGAAPVATPVAEPAHKGKLQIPANAKAPTQNANGQPVGPTIEESDQGYVLNKAALNDVFQALAKAAGRQYFHNAKISGPEFEVTGHLNDGNPLQQMEELAFQYGLSLHTKGSTVYALSQAQLAQLPGQEFHYQLRYLRPSDIKQIQELIRPMLSPATGIVNFEPKTNTIVVIDSAHRIEQARQFLRAIDRPKGQIIVETKIMRINSGSGERTGVDWSGSLGQSGTTLRLARDLNSVFGLDSPISDSTTSDSGSNLVLSPLQLNGVLRALGEGNVARQISNPTLITEDNEQATISIIDRVPIITTTSTATTSGGNPTVTEEVRYKIDQSDKGIDTDPDKHREIGISMVVTPTLLPDGTVRMKLRPRSAQIVEQITSITGNKYPRVTESMVESLARVPDGYSLVVGGFYGESKSDKKNKVPILGDVPVLNFFFKSKEALKEQTSLVFIVTPKSYNPSSGSATNRAGCYIKGATQQSPNWADDNNPGPAHEPNMRRTLRGVKPLQAPYYPLPDEQYVPVPDPSCNGTK